MVRRFRQSMAVRRLNRTPGVTAGEGCRVDPRAILDLSEGGTIELGKNVQVCAGAMLSPHGGTIRLGENVYVGPYCVLYGHGGLSVGNDTMIAAQCVIIPANHGFDRTDVPMRVQPLTKIGIEIGEDCWLAAGVKILDGVRIGRGCLIGAGAVVTRSVAEYSIARGVPARVVGRRGGPSCEGSAPAEAPGQQQQEASRS